MQRNDETRFEDFVGLISGLYKEIQRIKTSEGARLVSSFCSSFPFSSGTEFFIKSPLS